MSGQSLVEFVLTLFAFFTILFMYVQLALSFGVANYIQYMTFMAARAYLSSGDDQGVQTKAANAVITQMMSGGSGANGTRFDGIIQLNGATPSGPYVGSGTGVTFKTGDARSTAWEQGVTYGFNVRLYMLPIIRSSGKNAITLQSESWLGREPTAQECSQYMEVDGPNMKGVQAQFLYDNGC